MANDRARALRKSMTPQEVKLCVYLRSWKARGFHFRRQAPRQRYILDFVCLRHRLVVELDGGQHNRDRHAERDRLRDQKLVAEGFATLRFWNNEVDENLDGVLETIDRELQKRAPTRPLPRLKGRGRSHPPPQAGEG
jgi:very-short-patch-repair endonuclease